MKKLPLLLLSVILVLSSCSQFQKLLKSNDVELKFNEAKAFYDKKEYNHAAQLFEDISAYYKGTDRAEDVMYYLAKSYAGQKDFYSASENFKSYIKSFPRGKYAEESYFMIGYSAYLDSPDARLDQASTNDAIVAFSNFVESYPQSERTKQAYEYLTEMKDKLAYKAYLNAKTYYNLGSYLGRNCYASAVITANNALRIYTESKYRDDLTALVMKSKHAQAVESIEEKKADRYRDVIDECYSYINEFPNGKYIKDAQVFLKEAKNYVKEK
ncbi:MAG: outer rane assembly lipoprotein YfiO [Bacteroidetes bacterium]|nr:outer rane assembly lipoprotein YfiO [Bacteroidota bacterium]